MNVRPLDPIATFLDTLLGSWSSEELRGLLKTAVDLVWKSSGFSLREEAPAGLPTRKGEMAQLLCRLLDKNETLKGVYDALSEIDRAAVQEAVFDEKGRFDPTRFAAKYDRTPDFSIEPRRPPGALCLFIPRSGIIPKDLRLRLQGLIPRPAEAAPELCMELPSHVEISISSRREKAPLAVHHCEQAALQDLPALLQLVKSGRVGVSASTGQVTESGASAIRAVLFQGDYYPEDLQPRFTYDVKIGPLGIRPFAWVMLLQAGRLAKATGSRLLLTRAGEEAMDRTAHDAIRGLWDRWLDTDLLRELNRVEVIKGQKSKGHPLSHASGCRHAIAAALCDLPLEKWIGTDDFIRFLIARDHDFEAVRDPWKLYLADSRYGSFGYSHIQWNHLNGRFARAFLLEYGATLGVIDVALVPPWGAVDDLKDLWGADEISCLSRYDGLTFLSLTSLGGWILGRTKEYVPSPQASSPLLNVLPNLEIAVTGGFFPSSDRLFFERICEKTSDRVWRLSRPAILQAMENHLSFGRIREFLLQRNGGKDLPPSVNVFLGDLEERAHRLQDLGPARVIQCHDTATALLIVNDPKLKGRCFLAGEDRLVIPSGSESAFRAAIRKLGYILPPRESNRVE